MLILVINSGRSSIKYKLFEVARRWVMASGLAEKMGEASSILTHAYMTAAGEEKKHVEERRINTGVIGNQRVVHGGDAFLATTLIDDRVIGRAA